MLLRRAIHFLKYCVLLTVLLGVVGCGNPISGHCVEADNFGDVKHSDLTLDARGKKITEDGVVSYNGTKWVYSGIEVKKGRRLAIDAKGNIDICRDQDGNLIEETYTAQLDVTHNGWVRVANIPRIDDGIFNLRISSIGKFCTQYRDKFYAWRTNRSVAESDGACYRVEDVRRTKKVLGIVIRSWREYRCVEKYCRDDEELREGEGIAYYIGNNPPDASYVGNLSRNVQTHYSYIKKGSESYPEFSRASGGTPPRDSDNVYLRIIENWKDVTDLNSNGTCSRNGGCQNPWKTDSAYPNNYAEEPIVVSVKLKRECSGENGQFLLASIGGEGSGTIIDLHNGLIVGESGAQEDYEADVGIFNAPSPAGGKLYFRIIEDPNYDWDLDGRGDAYGNNPTEYENNRGSYSVRVRAEVPTKAFVSNIITGLTDDMKKILYGSVEGGSGFGLIERMYKGVIKNTGFIDGVRAVIALSIILLALGYVIGITQITQRELVIHVLKVAVVLAMISDTSWEFFYKHFYGLFIGGIDDLIYAFSSPITEVLLNARGIGVEKELSVAGASGTAQDTFAFLDETLGRFFTDESWFKMMGLLTMFPMGLIYFCLLLAGIIIYVYAVISALFVYILALLMIGFLLLLGPMIIVFILFSRTMEIFNLWVKYLLGFAIQPVVIFAVLSIFNVFVYSAFYTILAYNVCWRCVLLVDLPISEALFNNSTFAGGDFDRFCLIPFFIPWGGSAGGELTHKLMNTPVGWFSILIFVILTYIMMELVQWVVRVATTLVSGAEPINLSDSAKKLLGEAAEGTKGLGSLAKGYGKAIGGTYRTAKKLARGKRKGAGDSEAGKGSEAKGGVKGAAGKAGEKADKVDKAEDGQKK